MEKKDDFKKLFLAIHYIAGIIIACTFFYAHYIFPQGTRLMFNTSVPLVVRMIITLGLFVIPIIGFTDAFRGKFLSGGISFVLLVMIINNSLP